MKSWQGFLILFLILGAIGVAWYFVTKVSQEAAAVVAGKAEPSNVKINFGIS